MDLGQRVYLKYDLDDKLDKYLWKELAFPQRAKWRDKFKSNYDCMCEIEYEMYIQLKEEEV